ISGAPTNGYSFCLPGYTRSPGGIFSPAGKVTEITLPPTSGAGSWVPAWIITSVRWRDLIYLITNNNYVLHMTAPTTATLATVLPVASGVPRGVRSGVPVGTGSGAAGQCDQVAGGQSAAGPKATGNGPEQNHGGPARHDSINALVADPRHVYMLRPDGVYDM